MTITAKRYEANPYWMPAGRHWTITLRFHTERRIERVTMASENATQALQHALLQARERRLLA